MKYTLPMKLPDFLSAGEFGWVRIAGHRVSLVDVVVHFNGGLSAENIAARFPTISLAQIHHIIAFYLDHQPAVDAYVQSALAQADHARLHAPPSAQMPQLRQRVQALHAARTKAAHAP